MPSGPGTVLFVSLGAPVRAGSLDPTATVLGVHSRITSRHETVEACRQWR